MSLSSQAIDDTKSLERRVQFMRSKATTAQQAGALDRAARYLADARAALRMAEVLAEPPNPNDQSQAPR